MNTTDEAFQQVPLHNEAPKVTQPRTESVKIHLGEESPWSKQDIAEFQLNPAPSQSSESSFEELKYETVQPSKVTSAQLPTALNIAITEKVLREEAQKMLESMIWKILPEIAERVVKEEINKLLQETEKSI